MNEHNSVIVSVGSLVKCRLYNLENVSRTSGGSFAGTLVSLGAQQTDGIVMWCQAKCVLVIGRTHKK